MVGVWTYPWTLYEEGLEDACRSLANRGIEKLTVSSHHHSARIFQPRFPDALFEQRRGGCYFNPDDDRFAETPIKPIQNEISGATDPLGEIASVADDHGLQTNAWLVYLHNPRLGVTYPEYQLEDAFGNSHEHAFCPSHPEVREYFAAITAEAADRGVEAIETEAVGYPSVFHGHGIDFGHDARQALSGEAEERLFSQCFCDGCRSRARNHPVDMDRAQSVIQDIVHRSFQDPEADPLTLSDTLHEEPVLRDLFEFRASVIDELLESIAAAAGDTTVNSYVRQAGPDWPAGLTLDSLETHADRLTALCYVSDPDVARDRIRTLQRRVEVPIDVGFTLDPSVISRGSELAAMADAVRTETDGRVSVYNHAMSTEAQLDWVGAIAE